jgi:hypothetical protein
MWLQLLVLDCADHVQDEVLLSRHAFDFEDLLDSTEDDERCDDLSEHNECCAGDGRFVGDDALSRSLFIAAVSRCCGLLSQQASHPPLASFSQYAPMSAFSDRHLAVHDTVASAASRLFHRMAAALTVPR